MTDSTEKNTNVQTGKKKPVLLQILPELRSGGVERGTVEIAGAATRAGFTSLVASAGGDMVRHLRGARAEHITLPLHSKNPFVIYQNIKKLVEVIKKYQVDIVHARSRAPAWSAYYACQQTNTHFLTTFHGIYGLQPKLKRRYNEIMVRGERVIAISDFVARHIRQNYEVDPSILRLIPRGVDLEYFNPEKVAQDRLVKLLNEWNIPDDRPLLMLPGRITRWKGQMFLLEALKQVDPSKYFCVLVGDIEKHSNYSDELQEKVKEWGLEGSVRMVGNVVDMAAAYKLADVVVSASIEPEAFGRVAIEAQAMGKLLIATGHGGSKETVIHNETGWLVEPGNVTAMAEVINFTLDLEQSKREQVIKAAQAHIKEQFSLTQMCDKTLKVYEELLAEKTI